MICLFCVKGMVLLMSLLTARIDRGCMLVNQIKVEEYSQKK